jgi:DNA helicase-2/ATP-dependent DNA helicase PcrA
MTDAMTDATIPSWLLEKLNPAQMQAVQKLEGPLLLLAGAGSGKTRVLTHRMAALIASGRASPEEILCVTFTNKAAREMESRIYNLLSQMDVFIRTPLWVSTFHSFCVRILREHIELLGYRKFFNIYDSSDQLSLIKKTLVSLNINEKNYPPKNFQARISNAKMMGLGPDEFEKHPHFRVDAKTIDVYRRYEEG